MGKNKLIKESDGISDRFRVTKGKKFRLSDIDPTDTDGVRSKKHAERLLAESSAMLTQMQDMLFAQDRWGVLLILQGMDAAGKDGVIKHVMSGVNPEGCDVHSFKVPSHED